jgi:tripartite-type tricarboxylate transporter receptor subunit TctC
MQAQEAALVLNAHLFKKLPYKPQSDFSYIGAIARLPVALVVDAALPIHTIQGLMDIVAANPAKAIYASPGIGTPHHIAMELFKQSSGLRVAPVPYKGGAAALQDLMGGHLPTMMIDLGSGLQSIKAGKIRVLAIAARQRAQALPDVPTFDDLGFKRVSVDALQALIGPAGMTDETVKLLNAALNKALREPKVRSFFADIGAEALPGSPEDLKLIARAGNDRWGSVIKALELQIERSEHRHRAPNDYVRARPGATCPLSSPALPPAPVCRWQRPAPPGSRGAGARPARGRPG